MPHNTRMGDSIESTQRADWRSRAFWILVTLVALLLRVELIPLAPKYGYVSDHDEFVRWGIVATDRGLTQVYRERPPLAAAQVWNRAEQKWDFKQQELRSLCNYPPLSACLLVISGHAFAILSPDRIINTTTSRAIFSIWAIIADFVMAAGVAAIVARVRPGRSARWAYALMLAAPPFWIDSVFWSQMDAVLLAPLVWMVYAMLGGRWRTAGVLLGLAAALKPQAVLMGPLWLYLLLTQRPRRAIVEGLGLSALVLGVASLPFSLNGGAAWFRMSYVHNLFEAYGLTTTLLAFNVWHAWFLLGGSLEASTPLLGVSLDAWGKIILVAGLSCGFVAAYRRRSEPLTLLHWAGLSLLLCVMLPTRVHERYLLLALPFVIAGAFVRPRLAVGATMLVVAATLQVTWPAWLTNPPLPPSEMQAGFARLYDAQLAELPPDSGIQVMPREAFISENVRAYEAARRRTLWVEQAGTLLSLLGVAAVCVGLRARATGKTKRGRPTAG